MGLSGLGRSNQRNPVFEIDMNKFIPWKRSYLGFDMKRIEQIIPCGGWRGKIILIHTVWTTVWTTWWMWSKVAGNSGSRAIEGI